LIKNFYLFIIFLFLYHCSVDTKTGFWENKNDIKNSIKIDDLKFNYELSFEEFRNNAIEYGKLSKYPKLDK